MLHVYPKKFFPSQNNLPLKVDFEDFSIEEQVKIALLRGGVKK